MRWFMWLRFVIMFLLMSGPGALAQVQHNVATIVNGEPAQAAPTIPGPAFNPAVHVPFDKNIPVLVYSPEGTSGPVVAAMNVFGLTNVAVRHSGQAVSAVDLQNYRILVVGWNASGNMSGLNASILEAGLNGRVVLSGHDADWHTANSLTATPAAGYFLAQAMDFVLAGSGTGMVAMVDASNGFNGWLPESWGVDAEYDFTRETTTEFTTAGLASGIFNHLEPANMFNWQNSYHAQFTEFGNGFEAYELGPNGDVITIGTQYNARGIILTKEDNVAEGDCVSEDMEVVYTICYENTTGETITNAKIIDYLPVGVTYPEGEWAIDENMEPYQPDPAYDPDLHAYEWSVGQNELGTLYPDDYGCVTITVKVNSDAIPGMNLHNIAELVGDHCVTSPIDPNNPNGPTQTICTEMVIVTATKDTPVCCPAENGIVFVDQYAQANTTNGDNGLSWESAYNGTEGLKKALDRIAASTCQGPYTIYIASGNYFPGTQEEDSFVLPEGTEIYGGFPTGGCDFSLRNPQVYEALLTGQVDDDLLSEIDNVVTMGHNSLLDGVRITRAKECGVYGNTVNFSVKNCTISDNERYGISALNGNVTIERCKIQENDWDGIYHSGTGFTLDVSNSWVMRSGRYGINCVNSTPTVKNSIISESDMKQQGSEGIYIYDSHTMPVLYNNTIANNKGAGVYYENQNAVGDPNDFIEIKNCILYYNNRGSTIGEQLTGITERAADYCCIYGSTGINNNIAAAPMFAYPADPNGAPNPENYHLSSASPLIDLGCPYLDYSGQTDYDTEERLDGDGVEIGADELHSCSGDYAPEDFKSEADFNADGIVNLKDFQQISKAWLGHDPNDPAWVADPNMLNPDYVHPVLGPARAALVWSSRCNLAVTGSSQYSIDIADLEVFAEQDWLWQACWYEPYNSVTATMMATMARLPEPEIETLSLSRASSDNIATLARTTSKLLFVEEPEPKEVSQYACMSNSELAEFVRDIKDLKAMVQTQALLESEDSQDIAEILTFFDDILLEVKDYLIKQEE